MSVCGHGYESPRQEQNTLSPACHYICLIIYMFIYLLLVLGIEPRDSYMPDMHSSTTLFFFSYFSSKQGLYVDLPGFKLKDFKLQIFLPQLLRAGTKGVCHHTWLPGFSIGGLV